MTVALVNYEEDVYRQRFTAAHEGGHAILDDDQDVIVSFHKTERSSLSEVRANTFAARFLLPPELLAMIDKGRTWGQAEAVDWASRLRVSTASLAIALKEAGLIDKAQEATIRAARVPQHLKVDPELPESLAPRSRERKEELLRRGLSSFYVGLCFDAYDAAEVSAGRLAEMLLVSPHELGELADLYNRRLHHAG